MSLVSQSIKNMVAGVSQQPQILRMPDQADEQINCYSSESRGLMKRPPSKYIATLNLTETEVANAFVHWINRDESEQYMALITPYTDAPLPPSGVNKSGRAPRLQEKREILLTTVGGSQVPIPENTKDIEVFVLGGGGSGAGWKTGVPNDPGQSSYVKFGVSTVAEGGGGQTGDKFQAPGAGGAPNGNPGQWGSAMTGGQGGVAPDNVFGGTYGYGGQGHSDYGSAPSGGGGGSGGYVHAAFSRSEAGEISIIDCYVGAGGRVNNWESYGGNPGQPGEQGAIKIVFYIDDSEEGQGEKPMMNSSIRVFDMQGNEYLVRMSESGMNYLAGASGGLSGVIRAVTVADYTFVMNRLKVTQMTDDKSHSAQNEHLVHVKQGQYGKTYKIMINGEAKAVHTTPDGSQPQHSPEIDTTKITEGLVAKLKESGVNFTNGPNWIRIYPAQPEDIVTTADGFGDQAMFVFKHKVQKVSDLPKSAPDGYVVEVTGDKSTNADNYWLKYSLAEKTWEESVAFDILTTIDKATMPHALIRQADGTFTFDSVDWDIRKIGDEESNPIPSFIGNELKDIFFFRNRLGVIADENVILSASGKFFKFWNNTATTTTDTDPIDVAVSNNAVSLLQHAVPFNEELLLFSKDAQFIMQSDGVLSPKTIRVDKTTDFINSPLVRPITVGRNSYFVSEKTGAVDVVEFFASGQEESMDGLPITSHVNSYIPDQITSLRGSSAENMLLLHSTKTPSRIYVYKFLFSDQGRVQSSWSYWDWGGAASVVSFDFIGTHLYLLVKSGSGFFMESLQTNPDIFEYPEQPWKIYANRLAQFSFEGNEVKKVEFDAYTNETVFNIGDVYGVIPKTGQYVMVDQDGDTHDVKWDEQGAVRIFGNYLGQKGWVGELFALRYTFSRFLIKNQNENGWVTETEGRLQLRRGHVNFDASGPFVVEVTSVANGTRRESSYTGRQLGGMSNKVGSIPIGTGRFNFPIGREAMDAKVTIINTNPYACSFIGAGWEGVYSRRTNQI
ncbi:phage nozzle protein [Chromobacterium haemolyticum]|uniref:phage nozzle protein n=1 Tax=Chromobacterium TaxID=535 RepID=UPI004056D9DE